MSLPLFLALQTKEFLTSFLNFLAKTDANSELAHATTLYIGTGSVV